MRSGQGEVVSLIIFIVLTLALGVTTYFGFKSFGEQRAERESAQSELAQVKSDTTKLTSEFAAFKAKLGYEEGASAAEIAKQMKRDVAAALNSETSYGDKVFEKYAGPDDENEDALPNITFKEAVEQLKTNVAGYASDISRSIQDRDAQIQNAFDSIETSQEQKDTFVKEVVAARDKQTQDVEDARVEYDKKTAQFVEQTQKFDNVRTQAHDAVLEANAKMQTSKTQAEFFAEVNRDLSARIDELSATDFKVPDARVVYADQRSRTLKLDVGSADGVRPLMTFNVYPYDFTETSGGSSKGKIEVVRTLEEHSCEAKILEDDNGDPIRPGDIVYTSLWKPGEIESYALSYFLDINGDGVSDFQEVVNLVESNGFKVAAYVDNNGVVHGKMSPNILRVIVPDRKLDETLAANPDLDDQTREKLLATEQSFLESARSNGVREMQLSKFLVRMGYRNTDAIYNSGETKDPSMQRKVDGDLVAPIFYSSKVGATASEGVPYKTVMPKADPVDTHFRKRQPR